LKTIRKEEILSLISQIDNEKLKEKLLEFTKNSEIDTEFFFDKIKKLDMIDDNDYKLLLLLEEFYLRFKDAG
jgi:hypothetical protein